MKWAYLRRLASTGEDHDPKQVDLAKKELQR
jgi:hypothetical protein